MKNKLKSIFISTYITALLLGTAVAIWHLVAGRSGAWLSVLIALSPALLFFVRLFVRPIARTSQHLYGLLGFAAIGACSTLILSPASWVPFSLSLVVGLGGGVLYVFWYSRLSRPENDRLVVGQRLPLFTVMDTDGNLIPSDTFQGRPHLLLFFRGNWCPLCMAQIREVAAQYRELHARGVRVALVSPQPHENTQALAQRFDVPMEFYTDSDNKAAHALKINHDAGLPEGLQVMGYDSDTVFPTVIMTDAGGHIIFVDLTDNYRIRPEPDVFLSILDKYIK
ncbi:redoxin domain-containing protein [Kistimonas asteriae]|uniref:redoxin domain-containing protein n=1 Tax=Kistimonas asteriae TaxID=517724 RepID=UPI001BA6A377|nr:redoxin domain-containing protein [Kistimonas asteriae]